MIKALLIAVLLYCANSQGFLDQASSVANQAGVSADQVANQADSAVNQASNVASQANDAANQAAAAVPSGQDVQSLLNSVLSSAPNGVVLTIGDYEWDLTENGEGGADLNVVNVPGNNGNVAGTLAGLISAGGAALQNNVAAVNQAGVAQAQDAGVVFSNDNVVGQAAQQYGAQLQDNANAVSPALADAYNGAGAQLAANQNGVADQVNQQLNDAVNNNAVNVQDAQATASQLASNLTPDTVQGLNNAAVQAGNDAQGAAATVASGIDPAQSADALQSAANVNVGDAANAVNDAVNNGISQASGAVGVNAPNVDVAPSVNDAVNNAVNAATSSPAVNNAVGSALGGN